MTCCVCTGQHHAMSCPLARSTLLAAGVQPGTPTASHRPAYVDEPVTPNPYDAAARAALPDSLRTLHEMVIAESQALWRKRHGPPKPSRTRYPGIGLSRPRGSDGRFLPVERGMVTA